MDKDLEKVKDEFKSGKYTLVIGKDEIIIKSELTGIKPLINLLDDKKDCKWFSAADKIVGRAAAFLYILLEIKNLYAEVISKGAVELLKKAGINFEYKILTEFIENRNKNGICPMDEACLNVDNPKNAYEAIKQKLKFLQSHKI